MPQDKVTLKKTDYDKLKLVAIGLVIGVCLWLLLSFFFPALCSIERFTDYKDLQEAATKIATNIEKKVKEAGAAITEGDVIDGAFAPLRLKSNPDMNRSVVYNKDGSELEQKANGFGWATCEDSPLGTNVEANSQKAIEMCEELHRRVSPGMMFGNSAGEFTCRVVNDKVGEKPDGQSRAKACPHVRLVDKIVSN
mgnify:CR=1 FL=1|tara:strand:- start:333 stop:917 length:585 start_codon:yes stop_codon:yes gene_type:complete